ncbi:MAG: MBL fold metallo-hydrolase [Selenomonadaceae bacterium]|nr:MBL fold metallo-hydrolase [Selenomonadaceae bacterium]
MTTLTVLIENTAPESSELIAEHGLSILVETPRTKFIFDCGQTGAAFANAKLLGINLSGIKIAVLSHSHYDHAGGFPNLLDSAPIKKIYTGENFWEEKFSRIDEKIPNSSFLIPNCIYRGCGFDKKFLSARGVKQEICRDVLTIDEDVWLVGNFKRRYEFETIPKKFLRARFKSGRTADAIQPTKNFDLTTAPESCFISDDFSDEIILVLREGDGLAIVTACAHNGILNIVADVSERFSLPIYSVIGGLHLTGATQERISRTLDELKILGVKKILPCHCSGEDFIKRCGEKFSTSSVIKIS